MKILFKLASRSRPEKFKRCLQNIQENIRDKNNFHILVSADTDDDSMNDEAINSLQNDALTIIYGTSKNKIDAVNRDINVFNYEWDILINTSDDMFFVKEGFDDIVRMDMTNNFPDTDGVLHYNDGNQKDNVMTLSIMGRKYYDRFGYIYHPNYISLWSDVEATDVANLLGKYKYMGDVVLFNHLHPAWGLCLYDVQYRKSEDLNIWAADMQTLIVRRGISYGLSKTERMGTAKYSSNEVDKWIREYNKARLNHNLNI